MYNDLRTRDAVTYLLSCAKKPLSDKKILMLMYLAERESYRLYGEPISGDLLVLSPYGPALKEAQAKLIRLKQGKKDPWGRRFYRAQGAVSLIAPLPALQSLSSGDEDILQEVWSSYGSYPSSFLKAIFRSNSFPELEGLALSRMNQPISLGLLLKAVGYEEPSLLISRLKEQSLISKKCTIYSKIKEDLF